MAPRSFRFTEMIGLLKDSLVPTHGMMYPKLHVYMCYYFSVALINWICPLMRLTINYELNCCLPLGNVPKDLDLPSSLYMTCLYDNIQL